MLDLARASRLTNERSLSPILCDLCGEILVATLRRGVHRTLNPHLSTLNVAGYQTSLRKTSRIVASSADSLKGLMSTVALTRLKKHSIAGLFRWPVKKMNR